MTKGKMKTKIILIVGPSGVGKDTLLRYAKEEFGKKFNFVKRHITRKPDLNEDNYYIDDYAFEILRHNGYFSSFWNAHENQYGIAKRFINPGINIISISRSKIKDFEKQYDNVYTINITIPKELLKQRLLFRGRESKAQIQERLSRNYEKIKAKKLIDFDNSSSLEESKIRFKKLLKEIKNA
ncbi:MAG: hypothetical protein WBF48_14290 [Halarcobacter sp.]